MPPAAPSMKLNVVANYVTKLYVMVIGIVMAPVYLSYMGKEAYGLIGFFTMMAALFILVDMGLTPTLVRETARYRGGAVGVDGLRALLRALEVIFGAVSVGGALAIVLLAERIATRWLQVEDLPASEVTAAVMLMGLAVPLRWVSGLYRGVVNGFERQVWLGGYNVAVETARFVGVLAVFHLLGATPVHFFTYQLAVAVAELAGLMLMTYRLVRRGPGGRERFSWKPLRATLSFSLAIAFTASAWAVVTQTDKLVLSKVLPLAEYGMFSLAIVAASAINGLGMPFGQALLPRLTRLVAEGDEAEAQRLYRAGTQAVLVLVAPAVTTLALFAGPILLAWTGRPEVAGYAAPVLRLYAIGNGAVALCAFAYYLQYAKGDLRLHFIGSALFLVVVVPLFAVCAIRYGALGVAVVWAAANGLYALLGIPLIHARVFKGQHGSWLLRDVLAIVVPTAAAGLLLSSLLSWPGGRWEIIGVTALVAGALAAVAAGCSSCFRARALRLLRARS